MATRKRREVGDSAQSGPTSPSPDQSKCQWEKIRASTAKCDVCGKRNTKGSMVRCEHCRWQTCHSTCPTDPKCTHGRDGRRCAHQCDHVSHSDVAPDNGTRTARLTAANAGTARPRPRRASVRGRARANAGASSARLHADHGSGSSVTTAGARRPRVSRYIIASTLPSRSPSASGSGDRRARISPHIIPSRTVGSINASNREDSPLSKTNRIAARSGPNSPSMSSGEDDTSHSGPDIPNSINQADRNTARSASNPFSIFSDSPRSRPSSPSSPCTVANENDNTSCCEETPQISGTSLNKEDLDSAECLLALRIHVDIEFGMTRCGKCGNYNIQNPRACAFALAKECRQGWERVNLLRRKPDECRNTDDNSNNGDDEDDDTLDESGSDYVDP